MLVERVTGGPCFHYQVRLFPFYSNILINDKRTSNMNQFEVVVCVCELILLSNQPSFLMPIPEKAVIFYWHCAVYDACGWYDTIWPEGRIRLFAHCIISLSLYWVVYIYIYIWMLVRYSLSTVCIRLFFHILCTVSIFRLSVVPRYSGTRLYKINSPVGCSSDSIKFTDCHTSQMMQKENSCDQDI